MLYILYIIYTLYIYYFHVIYIYIYNIFRDLEVDKHFKRWLSCKYIDIYDLL